MSNSTARTAPDEEWDDLMRQLRGQQQLKAQPRPFFYYRVHARLTVQAAYTPVLPSWLRRPAYAALCGAVVLALAGDCTTLHPAVGEPCSENNRPQLLPR